MHLFLQVFLQHIFFFPGLQGFLHEHHKSSSRSRDPSYIFTGMNAFRCHVSADIANQAQNK